MLSFLEGRGYRFDEDEEGIWMNLPDVECRRPLTINMLKVYAEHWGWREPVAAPPYTEGEQG